MEAVYCIEECKYCKNRKLCKYKAKVEEMKLALAKLESSYKGVYGSLKWKCDFFVFDREEYWKDNMVNKNWINYKLGGK